MFEIYPLSVPGPAVKAIRVLVAPDSFKSSISATRAASHLAAGLAAHSDCIVVGCPIADGGEGTITILARLGAIVHRTTVTGALGRPVEASWAALDGIAYVEVAQGSGAHQVSVRNGETCLSATSTGVGELIVAAMDAGHRRIVLTTGGSGVTDGGAGMLSALGARILPAGAGITGGGSLSAVRAVDLSSLDPRLAEVEITVAVDVDNPLTGPYGSARTFAPQKGAGRAEVQILEAGLARWARLLVKDGAARAQERGAGASGGIGFAAMTALQARSVRGADLVLDLLGIDELLLDVDLVVTGEGSFDRQSLAGKAPVALAARARARRIPVVVVAGRVELGEIELAELGILRSWSLECLAGSADTALAEPGTWLDVAGCLIAADLLQLTDAAH